MRNLGWIGVWRLERTNEQTSAMSSERDPFGDERADTAARSATHSAGGAITRLSDPLEEWGEVELKARRIVETVAEVERKLERERD